MLFSPILFPAGCWCLPCPAFACVVLWLPPGCALPLGFAALWRSQCGIVAGSQPYRDGVAMRLGGSVWLRSLLCEQVQPPPSCGSRTAGCDLAW